MTRMRRGSRMRRAMASGARASGGETIAPSTKPTAQGQPSNQFVAAETAMVVKTTQPIASTRIGRRLNWNSRQLMLIAEM